MNIAQDIFWLKYDNYSCSYDSFTFLLFTNIMLILTNSPDLIRSKNINDLIQFTDKIKISLKDNNNNIRNILDFEEKYKNISLISLDMINDLKNL